MQNETINSREERKDKITSAIITSVVWGAILLFVLTYTVTQEKIKPQEVVTTMLMNFGDNKNGNGEEEPAPEEGSLSAETMVVPEENPASSDNAVTTKVEEAKPEPKKEEVKKNEVKEKVITGTKKETKAVKAEDKTEVKTNKTSKTASTSDKSKTTTSSNAKKTSTANSNNGSGDGKGNAAIGSFLEGRGKNKGTQGTGNERGNAGDPAGGAGNGDSKIGVDRSLVAFIPGTMGRGGAHPDHSCTASGTITIAYTVDKSGNVVTARRQSGISDPCVVSTSVSWVKKYVKAEKAPMSSTGTYKITF